MNEKSKGNKSEVSVLHYKDNYLELNHSKSMMETTFESPVDEKCEKEDKNIIKELNHELDSYKEIIEKSMNNEYDLIEEIISIFVANSCSLSNEDLDLLKSKIVELDIEHRDNNEIVELTYILFHVLNKYLFKFVDLNIISVLPPELVTIENQHQQFLNIANMIFNHKKEKPEVLEKKILENFGVKFNIDYLKYYDTISNEVSLNKLFTEIKIKEEAFYNKLNEKHITEILDVVEESFCIFHDFVMKIEDELFKTLLMRFNEVVDKELNFQLALLYEYYNCLIDTSLVYVSYKYYLFLASSGNS